MKTESQSTENGKPNYEPIEKGVGVTTTEHYLSQLCEKTFLSLWSYPGVYRDQGKPRSGGHGKEICDLLVVFGDHIIVFSDKHCELKNSGNAALDWQRWFRNAIRKSAEQAWGAQRWIQQNPSRIFLDRECKRPLPIELPKPGKARFHLIVVAHGISSRMRQEYGGSGSLMLNTKIKGFDMHSEPFYVGDLAPEKTFVHILDDDSLGTLMRTRDTISDFVAYIAKRQLLLRGQCPIVATGEEQLLAIYLNNINENHEHVFEFGLPAGKPYDHILVTEGHWESFQNSPRRIAQLAADSISYAWDELIEKFNFYALRAEQYYVTPGGIKDTEKALRFLAREPRWKRRYLAKHILELVRAKPANLRRLRVINPAGEGDPYYVFLILPVPTHLTNERYRTARLHFLEDCCAVVRLTYPDATDVVGIATESDADYPGRSEDIIYADMHVWNAEMEKHAKQRQKELRILTSATEIHEEMQEYPEAPDQNMKVKNPRNKKCPCGSGKKYKYCCMNA